MQNSPRSDAFRYIVLKLMNPADEKHGVTLRRMAAGLACCLEAAVARSHYSKTPMPEFSQGEENRRHWLGRPTGEMIRLACRAPDVLRQANSDISSLPGADLRELLRFSCFQQRDRDRFQESRKEPADARDLTGLQVPAGDLTLYANVQAIDPLQDFAREDWVPRIVRASMTGIPDYRGGQENTRYTRTPSGCSGPTSLRPFPSSRESGRRAAESISPWNSRGKGESACGAFALCRIGDLRAGIRDGVVLVNPSLDSYTFHLKSLFPNVTSYRRIQGTRPSSVHVAKHGHKKGSSEDEAKDIEEMAAYNNGEAIADPESLTVPPLNALFLVTKR